MEGFFVIIAAQRSCEKFGDLHMCPSTKTQRTMLPGIFLTLIIATCFPLKLHAQSPSLRIALLPILDAFPYYVAEANGYFEEYGLKVKAVPVMWH